MLPFAVGDELVATIAFDSEGVPTGGGGYPGPLVSTISVGDLEISYDAANLTVACNVAAYCPQSTLGPLALFTNEMDVTFAIIDNSVVSDFLVNMVGWFPTDPNAFDFIMAPMFEIYLVDPAGSPLDPPIPSGALPTAPYNIAAIAMKTGTFRWIAPPSSGSTTSYAGHFSIDSMTLVSASAVPSMTDNALVILAIFLVGFCGLQLAAKKSEA